jgi:hypothetical protein
MTVDEVLTRQHLGAIRVGKVREMTRAKLPRKDAMNTETANVEILSIVDDLTAYAQQDPGDALFYAAHILPADVIDMCAARFPYAALDAAAYLLTPERLDACAASKPAQALRFASDLLTPERLDWCAEMVPWAALKCAKHRLTPERLAWCEAQYESDRPHAGTPRIARSAA